MTERFFTIAEARALLPELRQLISSANDELAKRSERLHELNLKYLKAERALDESETPDDEDDDSIARFRQQRANFELAISELSCQQSEFIRCLETWVDKITARGVILRKMQEGLVDFPCRNGDFRYFLCWQFGEDDITHWHLADDGFVGRKALVTLSEYC